ncbi:hypothetical protein B0H10DRAFT_2187489 [Mycena sp. CBHHK59/15]|nr:hypothetical protein B0H10DRAFT_2187489 [Mycena sp. CBHHK59/15]
MSEASAKHCIGPMHWHWQLNWASRSAFFSRTSCRRTCGNMVHSALRFLSLLCVLINAVLAEICSALPLSGSIYIGAAESAGPKYARFFGFIVAWWSCTAWMTFAAGNCQISPALLESCSDCRLRAKTTANYVVSQLAVWEIDFPGGITNDNVKWRALIWAISEASLVLSVAINYLPPRMYSDIFRFSVALIVLDFFLCVIWLPIGVSKTYGFRSAKDVFTMTYNGTGAPAGWNWILSFLFTAETMTGFDASGHIAEETKNANVVAGKRILTSAVATGVLGFVTTILFLFCTPDLDTLCALVAPQPFVQIYALALGKGGSMFMTITPSSALCSCIHSHSPVAPSSHGATQNTRVTIVAASRLVVVVARDGVLPLSSWISKVTTDGQPRNTATVIFVFAAALLCTIIPSQSSHFRLGVSAKPFYAGAVFFNTMVFVVMISPFFFPVAGETFDFACVIFGSVTVFGIASWYLTPEDKWLRRELVLKALHTADEPESTKETQRVQCRSALKRLDLLDIDIDLDDLMTCLEPFDAVPVPKLGTYPMHETPAQDKLMGQAATSITETIDTLSAETAKLVQIMTQQTEVLRRIETCQATAGLSWQSMPQVPATSGSAWNPLLKSFVTETIQPKVDRWRSSLDALLVFLGLFSAIVTAFFVDSLSGLQPDETARTNELLANLTDILIMLSLSSNPATTPNFTHPVAFQPKPSDIRVNSYYSVSLVLCLSIAALAVAGRGFVNMVTWSRHKKAALRLADIYKRWDAAESKLRPAIELLPHLLILPVLLFIAGILDTLFSTVLQLCPRPPLILATTVMCLIAITVVACLLCTTFLDGGLNPETSAFQSTFAALFHLNLVTQITSFCPQVVGVVSTRTQAVDSPGQTEDRYAAEKLPPPRDVVLLPVETIHCYHDILQATHDDNVLDQAASALLNLLQTPSRRRRTIIAKDELLTFIHLLSPEASFRSNRTAAEVFCATYGNDSLRNLAIFDTAHGLLNPLLFALKRYHRDVSPSLSALWDSPFIRAIAVIVGYPDTTVARYPPVLHIIAAKVFSWKSTLQNSQCTVDAEQIVRLMIDVLSAKLRDKPQDEIYSVLGRGWDEFLPSRFLQSLLIYDNPYGVVYSHWLPCFIAWMTSWASADHLVSESLLVLRSDLFKQPWLPWSRKTVLYGCMDLIINQLADKPHSITGDEASPLSSDATLNLCILCTSYALKSIESREVAKICPPHLPTWVKYFPRTLTLARQAFESPEIAASESTRPKLLRLLSELIRIKNWLDTSERCPRMGEYLEIEINTKFQFVHDYGA